MNPQVEINWEGNMAFETTINGHELIMDADFNHFGNNTGHRPKPLLLAALAGCTGMDVVSLLKKMNVEFDDFKVSVDGELTIDHPMYYHKIHIIYIFKGGNLEMDKIKKVIHMSLTKYCGVYAMLSKASTITHEIKVIE